MSETETVVEHGTKKDEGESFDLRSLLRPRRGSETKGPVTEFLTSNVNNPTKSRIPHAAGMAVYQLIGLWSATTQKVSYRVQGRVQIFERNVAGSHKFFKMLYDEDAISLGGKSREEGVVATLGYYLQDIESVNAAHSRLGEKGGASKSK